MAEQHPLMISSYAEATLLPTSTRHPLPAMLSKMHSNQTCQKLLLHPGMHHRLGGALGAATRTPYVHQRLHGRNERGRALRRQAVVVFLRMHVHPAHPQPFPVRYGIHM